MFSEALSTRIIAALSLSLVIFATSPVFAESSGAIDATTALSREDVGQTMEAEAAARGLAIDTEGLVYASRDDVTIVNAGLLGVEDLGEADLAAGADVTFVYIASDGLAPIADGFYTLHVTLGPDGSDGTGELIATDGSVAYATSGKVGKDLDGEWMAWPKFTGSLGASSATVDAHWDDWRIEITLGW